MTKPTRVSAECVEQMHTWILSHCPCSLEEAEFFHGFIVIVEDELQRAIQIERRALLDRLSQPNLH